MKIISFSLWGNNPMYTYGALRNIDLAKEIYVDWKCRFYFDSSVSKEIIEKIEKNGGETIFVENIKGSFHGMFWRFLAADDKGVDVFISRDCDSRLNYREKVAVDEWLKSDKILHTMHDHPWHAPVPILGGMWGLKNGVLKNMSLRIDNWGDYHRKGIDQKFLKKSIWPELCGKCMRHDSQGFGRWGSYRKFPQHMPLKFGGKYVGEIFNEKDIPVAP